MMATWSADQRNTLLALARQALVAAVRRGPPPAAVGPAVFDQRAGAFVTLRSAGDLRGCIGQVEARRLADLVVHCAGAAALEDPRFSPVVDVELSQIHIELSVLGSLTPLADPSGLEPGRHGLVISSAGRQGLLLPQVATEWGWTRDELLRQTCLKAGLPPAAWRQGAQLFTFEAEIFGEPES
ncbi:MAG: AmmeMemoRadiSam system protein A [Vicinamibacteria bacterium]|nr:AmmeMemoRadiSam system protein A [Vicinamibacteria bacterium]